MTPSAAAAQLLRQGHAPGERDCIALVELVTGLTRPAVARRARPGGALDATRAGARRAADWLDRHATRVDRPAPGDIILSPLAGPFALGARTVAAADGYWCLGIVDEGYRAIAYTGDAIERVHPVAGYWRVTDGP